MTERREDFGDTGLAADHHPWRSGAIGRVAGEEEHAAREVEDAGRYSFQRAAQEAVQRVAEELRDMTPNVDTMVRGGAPADQIIRAADELEADLIVVGGRGKGTVEAMVLGSVAYRVLHHAPCPVLVTR